MPACSCALLQNQCTISQSLFVSLQPPCNSTYRLRNACMTVSVNWAVLLVGPCNKSLIIGVYTKAPRFLEPPRNHVLDTIYNIVLYHILYTILEPVMFGNSHRTCTMYHIPSTLYHILYTIIEPLIFGSFLRDPWNSPCKLTGAPQSLNS